MQDVTTWFKITLWNKQAENASKYLTKGSPVYIEGRLRVEEWTDRDGNNRQSLEVNGTDMQFISAGTGGRNSDFGDEPSHDNDFDQRDTAPNTGSMNQSVPSDDDIPF